MLDIERFDSIAGSTTTAIVVGSRPAELAPLAKAYPATSLINPGWKCSVCSHRNPVTEPFCEKCPK